MKICFWGNIAKGFEGKPIGGGEKQLYLISSELSKVGNDITIIDFEVLEDFAVDKVEILSLKKFCKQHKYYTYYGLYKLMMKVNPDLFYARIRSSIHLIGLIAAKRRGKKFIYHAAHDLDSASFKVRNEKFYKLMPSFKKRIVQMVHSELLFPFLLRNVDLIFAQNRNQEERFKESYKKVLVRMVNNIFLFDSDLKENKKSYQYDFITVGSIDLRKGIQELLYLIKNTPKKKFVVVGKARDVNGEKFIEDINKLTNVTYFPNVEQREVLRLLCQSKYLITTSTGEGFPNVFLESWSMGTPVISLYINPSNVLNEYHLGKFNNGKIEEMQNDLLNMKEDQYDRPSLVTYVREHHNPKNIIKIIENTIKNELCI